ncbi:hypothetical protein UP10_38630 [Bradyrhizobium sp. LTSPM299]|nr:hypothetical protein UP10_38630 [Bradyrhizobium sp. LTSPM299]
MLGADLDRVAGTSLDKGAELDAHAAMPADARALPIQRGRKATTVEQRTAQRTVRLSEDRS